MTFFRKPGPWRTFLAALAILGTLTLCCGPAAAAKPAGANRRPLGEAAAKKLVTDWLKAHIHPPSSYAEGLDWSKVVPMSNDRKPYSWAIRHTYLVHHAEYGWLYMDGIFLIDHNGDVACMESLQTGHKPMKNSYRP